LIKNLRDIAHLRPRTSVIGCVTRLRSNLSFATHNYFQDFGFINIHTPLITTLNCENVQELFTVTTLLPPSNEIFDSSINFDNVFYSLLKDFFKQRVYLTCSGQLQLESYACALTDVYSFGPAFRAEEDFTTRHLAEFWMLECEKCKFIKSKVFQI
jgi:asparaginyl-tRNA synthetase